MAIAAPVGLVFGIAASIIQIYTHFCRKEDPELISSVDEPKGKVKAEPIRPTPVTLGKISNITLPHNPNFTGRADILKKLHKAFSSGERVAFTQTSAIAGLGGVGKTQIALQYTYTHLNDYQVIWWVRSDEPVTLTADYACLATRLALPEKDSQDQRVIVEAVRCWLEQNGGWLLVFDNAQEPKDLDSYLPRAGNGHVIITSRKQSWGGVARILTVDIFTPTESIEFLRRRTGQDDDVAAKALAEALGNLPLALEQAGAYIQETGISLSAYLRLFLERHEGLLSRGKPDAYPDTVATTWDLSFQKASEEVLASADLLNLSSFLAPDDIPKTLLVQGSEYLPEPLASAVSDEILLNDAIGALSRYSLLSASDDALSIHRLVQAVTRDRLAEVEGKDKIWVEAAVKLVNKAFPYGSSEVRTWPTCSRLLPHVLSSTKGAEEREADPEVLSNLLRRAGMYMWGRADLSDARLMTEKALKIRENAYGSDDPSVADFIESLGIVLRGQGDLERARKCHERALKIRENAYGPDHCFVAYTFMNLAVVLYFQGDLDGSRRCAERALKIFENAYGPNHPDVAKVLSNLGSALLEQGDLDEARTLQERALKIFENAYGPNHPDVAKVLNSLGSALLEQGDLDEARTLQERALKILENAYGPDHPEVAEVLDDLGEVLQAMGDLEGAKEHYERAIKIVRDKLGDGHPRTVAARNNLESLKQQM